MTQGTAARRRRWLVATAAACALVALPSLAAAQVLAVPYFPQSEQLCGGAAAAMVMRYWGASEIYPDAFQSLVDRRAGGIRTGALADDLVRRGWQAVSGSGDAAEIGRQLGRRRPIIALIQDSPGRYHYVVVVGMGDGHVTLHDPARAPSRVVDAARFDAEWRKSGRWMLILLPPASAVSESARVEPASSPGVVDPVVPTGACGRLVAEGVDRAAVDRVAARAVLTRAAAECPAGGGAWRELAGLDALDGDWAAAADHARRAVTLDPGDSYGWRILATADYVRHDDLAALAAWNEIGEPAVSLIDVRGIDGTRYGVIADAIGVPLRSILTPTAVALAERRVREVPSVAAARVAFHPLEDGRVQVDASIFERDRVPWNRAGLARMGFDSLVNREVSAAFSSPTGGGEVVGATWRWWEHRPMIGAFAEAPAPRRIGGTWRLDAVQETQTFGRDDVAETRTSVAMTIGNWITDRTRFKAGAAFERWSDRSEDVRLSYEIEHWRLQDRLRLAANVSYAPGPHAFATGGATVAARSKSTLEGFVLSGTSGYSAAAQDSPMSVWPGADTGHARDVLLRAHPLLDDGIVKGGAFGRRLVYATAEGQRWRTMRRIAGVRMAPAAFVDVGKASDGLAGTISLLHVDAGAGLRMALPAAGMIRIDVAHGLRDGGTVLSAGWDVRWR